MLGYRGCLTAFVPRRGKEGEGWVRAGWVRVGWGQNLVQWS
jgi:hypothetical protein